MGPLDPTPPMVTAGAPDMNAQLAQLLMRRRDAAKQATLSAGNAKMWDNTIGKPQFTQTVDGGRNQPDQVVINYGDILGKGVSNYMGAKERKRSVDKNAEVAQINSDFMQSTLQNDPAATKLYGAVQAGVPGADKALMEHMAPKKEKMAVLVQGLTSGMMDPQLAEQLATQYGLDPSVVKKAAEYAASRQEQKSTDSFAQKAALQTQDLEGKKELMGMKPTKSGYTQDELNAMPPEQRMAIATTGGRETAESKERGKMRVAAEVDLPKTDYAMNNLNDVIKFADEATYYPGTLGLAANAVDRSGKNAMLRQAIAGLVLDATGGKLGGGVSNADVAFLKEAQTNLESGNRNTVVAQLNKLLAQLKSHRATLSKQAGVSAPNEAPSTGPTSPLDYTNYKNTRKSSAPAFDDVFPPGTFEGE